MIESLFKLPYRLLVKSGFIKVFVNRATKRVALTTSWYMYKTGLIPYNPTRKEIKYVTKTKIQIKKVVERPPYTTPRDPNPLVPAGNLIPENNSSLLPVIVFDTRGDKNLDQYVESIAQLQLVTFGFKPLFLTNNPDFSPYRKYGYLFEYIPKESLFKNINTNLSYLEFSNQRLVEIIALYQPRRIMKTSEIEPYIKSFINPASHFI